MNWDSWIELDNEWKFYHDLKLKRLQEKESELSGCLIWLKMQVGNYYKNYVNIYLLDTRQCLNLKMES